VSIKPLLTVAALLTSAVSANAADMYTAPAGGGLKDAYVPSVWAGWYAGVNGGYGFNSDQAVDYYFTFIPPDARAGTIGRVPSYNKLSQDGGFGGGQVGYNWQSGRLVYGLEADIQISGISGTVAGTPPSNSWDTYSLSGSLDWFGTFRGRLGYAFGPALVYATGGLAYGKVESDIAYSSLYPSKVGGQPPGYTANGNAHQEKLEVGYVIGGGIEYALTPKWTIKGEYQYIDLGSHTATTIDEYSKTVFMHAKVDDNYSTVRGGLNYKIGGAAYEPLK
jgi:outer membrane immunogenic protein